MLETIGQQLKKERERRNLTIEQVVNVTHIRARHLVAIESDRLEDLPSQQAMRGFLHIYADYLGLSLAAQQSGSETAAVEDVSALTESTEKLPNIPDDPEPHPEAVIKESTLGEIVALEPETPPQPSLSQAIFISIGEQLRQQRELLGFSFDEIERHTHVRRHYLEALEAGGMDRVPSSVQARGMLSNYANFLDMDVDAILLRLAEGLQAQLQERQPVPVEEDTPRKGHRNLPKALRPFLSFDVIFGGGLIILLVAFAIWGTGQVISQQNPSVPGSTLSISAALLETPLMIGEIATYTSTPVELTPLPVENETPASLPTAPQGRVQVIIIVLERTWIRVVVDGELEFEGRVLPGNTYPFGGDLTIAVLTGSGSAIQIIYNQKDLGVMGSFGEIVERTYTETSVYLPTPTITPTPTMTKPATPGPFRTVTPAISLTEAP